MIKTGTTRTIIKRSSRFQTEHVITNHDELFVKKSLQPEFNEKIANEVSGASSLNNLLQDVGWLRAEKILESGENWLVTEWLKGGPLATHEQFFAKQNPEALYTFAKIAAQLDEKAVANLSQTSEKHVRLSSSRILPGSYIQKVQEKFKPFVNQPGFDEKLFKVALNYFDSRIESLQACWQHGDLTPWHIFKSSQALIIIDCEHVKDDWPRFYDIANFYSQLVVRFSLEDWADKMLADFSDLRSEDVNKSQAFWAVVVLRSARRISEHYDSPEMVKRAFKLLDKIVKKEI